MRRIGIGFALGVGATVAWAYGALRMIEKYGEWYTRGEDTPAR